MADPGWAARTPEENDLLLKAGAGVVTHLANQAAWTALAATHHGSSIASTINTVATSASWTGSGSRSTRARATPTGRGCEPGSRSPTIRTTWPPSDR